jgi:hypothetical protein
MGKMVVKHQVEVYWGFLAIWELEKYWKSWETHGTALKGKSMDQWWLKRV